MISTLRKPFSVSRTWKNLSRKVFNCPQCSQKLRVPIRPGRVLEVRCNSCQCQFRLDFKIPLIEFFRWQSGKSLKLNLVDLKNRFWNLSLRSKVELFFVGVLAVVFLNFFYNSVFTAKKVKAVPSSQEMSSAVRRV